MPSTSLGWVGFRVTQVLCLFESCAEVEAVLGHPREDVVRRAVDDRMDCEDVVGREVAHQWRDNRSATTDAGLEQHLNALLAGRGQYLRTAVRHHFLVGGDHVLALGNSLEDVLTGGTSTAHDLYDYRDTRVFQYVVCTRREKIALNVNFSGPRRISNKDPFEVNRATNEMRQLGTFFGEYLRNTSTNDTQTKEADTDGGN